MVRWLGLELFGILEFHAGEGQTSQSGGAGEPRQPLGDERCESREARFGGGPPGFRRSSMERGCTCGRLPESSGTNPPV
jgi:hypothetical protein